MHTCAGFLGVVAGGLALYAMHFYSKLEHSMARMADTEMHSHMHVSVCTVFCEIKCINLEMMNAGAYNGELYARSSARV